MTVELSKEPKISFVVPVYNVDKGLFKRCLMSLEDQDYSNIEVICVLDGPNEELELVTKPFSKNGSFKKGHFKVVTIPHGGAPAARNAGFKASTGEIISFFNSDYIAKSGMVRMWVDELQKHPDCGFLYGPYEYGTRDRAWYGSKPFDPWQLEQANYIDCGFPVWRKHVVEWDENCKSLQDWDFWLRIVKKGVKGHYMDRDISFIADIPRDGGLSVDSSSNWVDRVEYIKKKNGLPPSSDLVVTSIGAGYHGANIAKMLGADYRDDTIFKPNKYKAIYMIGFYLKPNDEGNQHPQVLSHFDNATKILHFVGADIYWLRRFPHEQLKYVAGALNLKCKHVLCETKQAQDDLAEMGIKSKVVPIPLYQSFDVKPLPERFRVAVFLTNKTDFDKYCKEETLSVIRACPDIEFSSYGDGAEDIEYPNLKNYGNLDLEKWKKFVYDNSCYMRIVRHDTRPMASDEFIMAGRDVITNVPMPFMHGIDTSGDPQRNEWDVFGTGLNAYRWPDTKTKIVKRIRSLRDLSEKDSRGGVSRERVKAHNFYANELNRKKYIDTIRGMVNG